MRRSTSASVRCSRVRNAALGKRVGVTVRFSMLGATSFKCAFVICLALPVYRLVGQCTLFKQLAKKNPPLSLSHIDSRGSGHRLLKLLIDQASSLRSTRVPLLEQLGGSCFAQEIQKSE